MTAAERVKARDLRKRPRHASGTETATKKARRDQRPDRGDIRYNDKMQIYGQDRLKNSNSRAAADAGSYPLSVVGSKVGDCIVVGEGEMSLMELQNYLKSQSQPSLYQLSPNSPVAVQDSIRQSTPTYTESPVTPSQVDRALLTPSDSGRMVLKAHEALSILEIIQNQGGQPRESREGGQPWTEKVSPTTAEPLSPQSIIATHQDLPMNTYLSSDRPQSSNPPIVIMQLPIADLLNEIPSADEHTRPPISIIPTTAATAPPSIDTGLKIPQENTSAGLQPSSKSFISSGGLEANKLFPTSATLKPPASHLQTSGAAEPTLIHNSDIDSTSIVRNNEPDLESDVIAQKLAQTGKIFIRQNNAPDL